MFLVMKKLLKVYVFYAFKLYPYNLFACSFNGLYNQIDFMINLNQNIFLEKTNLTFCIFYT